MDYLTDNEIADIKRFIKTPSMKEAVKKVLFAGLFQEGTMGQTIDLKKNWVYGMMKDEMGRDFAQTDAELGSRVKAAVEGISMLLRAWTEMEKLKETQVNTPKGNPAR